MGQGLLIGTHEFGHADENLTKKKGKMNPSNRVRKEEATDIVLGRVLEEFDRDVVRTTREGEAILCDVIVPR